MVYSLIRCYIHIYIYIYIYIYIISDKLIKEESVTINSRKAAGIETTHKSKMLPNVKKQVTNIRIYRHKISQCSLFMHLTFLPFEIGLVK